MPPETEAEMKSSLTISRWDGVIGGRPWIFVGRFRTDFCKSLCPQRQRTDTLGINRHWFR
jgi:hypothetical protein